MKDMTTTRLVIKDWAEEDRPREKLLSKGVNALSDSELVAILIGSGNQDETAVELSQRILASVDNNINQLGKTTVPELVSGFKGIGEAKAVSIVAAMELGRRRKAADMMQRQSIMSSKDVYEYFYPIMIDLPYEEFWMVMVNRSNKIIDKVKLGQGGVGETFVDLKILLKHAVLSLCSGVLLAHNHPSGNRRPSEADDSVTKKIKEALGILDIALLDHVIVCDGGYYSYADHEKIVSL